LHFLDGSRCSLEARKKAVNLNSDDVKDLAFDGFDVILRVSDIWIDVVIFPSLHRPLRTLGDPSRVTETMLEHSWSQEPRGLHEILAAEDLLFHQVWYDRHSMLRQGVRSGRIKVVEKATR